MKKIILMIVVDVIALALVVILTKSFAGFWTGYYTGIAILILNIKLFSNK